MLTNQKQLNNMQLCGYRICLQCRRPEFDPWAGKIPWGRKWQPTTVFAWRIPWTEEPGGPLSMGLQESDTTKQLTLSLTWGVYLSVSYLFAFSYCSWGSQGKNSEVVWDSLLWWAHFVRTFHHDLFLGIQVSNYSVLFVEKTSSFDNICHCLLSKNSSS